MRANSFGFDIYEPKFTLTQIVGAWPSITPIAVQNWVGRKLIDLQQQQPVNPGKMKRRRYSAADILRLIFVEELTSLGITATVAAFIANSLVSLRLKLIDQDVNKRGVFGLSDSPVHVVSIGGGGIQFVFPADIDLHSEAEHELIYKDRDSKGYFSIQVHVDAVLLRTMKYIYANFFDENGVSGTREDDTPSE